MEHHVVEMPIDELRPTQLTAGLVEVERKRREWRALGRKRRREVLQQHVVPCVVGPKGRRYVIDHHHLCLALQAEGVRRVYTHALDDLSWLPRAAFWRTLEFRRWVHPYDAAGRRRAIDDIPRSIDGLRDDPYRSLAALVRFAGGYAKDVVPYAEFEWAEFFRPRVQLEAGTPIRAAQVRRAVHWARGAEARYLPGWCGGDVDVGG